MRTSTPEHLTSKRTVPVKPTGEGSSGDGVIIQLGEDKENRTNPNIPMSGIQNALMQKTVMAGSPGSLQNGSKSSGQITAGSKRRLSNLTSSNLEPKAGHLYSASYISVLNNQHGTEEAKVNQAERSLGNPLITGGSSPREILELHQRSLTPKTVNELLAEKRKKLSQSPGLGANSPPGTKVTPAPPTGMKFAKQLPIKVHELLHGHNKSASNASQVANSKQGSPQLGPPQQSTGSSSLNLSKKTLPTPADASSGKMSSSTRQSLAQGGLISNGSLAATAVAGSHKASSPNFYQSEHKTVNPKPNGVYPIKSIAFSSSQANTQQGSPGRAGVGVGKRNTVGNGASNSPSSVYKGVRALYESETYTSGLRGLNYQPAMSPGESQSKGGAYGANSIGMRASKQSMAGSPQIGEQTPNYQRSTSGMSMAQSPRDLSKILVPPENPALRGLADRSLITTRCVSHPDLRSEFFVVQDEKVLAVDLARPFLRGLCSKCAVALAHCGFVVEEATFAQQSPNNHSKYGTQEDDESEDPDVVTPNRYNQKFAGSPNTNSKQLNSPGGLGSPHTPKSMQKREHQQKTEEFNRFVQLVTEVCSLTKLTLANNQDKQQKLQTLLEDEKCRLNDLEVFTEGVVRVLRNSLQEAKKMCLKEFSTEIQRFKNKEADLQSDLQRIEDFAKNLTDTYEETLRVLSLDQLRGSIKEFEVQLIRVVESNQESIESKLNVAKIRPIDPVELQELEGMLQKLYQVAQDKILPKNLDIVKNQINKIMAHLGLPISKQIRKPSNISELLEHGKSIGNLSSQISGYDLSPFPNQMAMTFNPNTAEDFSLSYLQHKGVTGGTSESAQLAPPKRSLFTKPEEPLESDLEQVLAQEFPGIMLKKKYSPPANQQNHLYLSFDTGFSDTSQIPFNNPSQSNLLDKSGTPTGQMRDMITKLNFTPSQTAKKQTQQVSDPTQTVADQQESNVNQSVNDSSEHSFSNLPLSGEPLFILSPTGADFVNKQTPDWGSKNEMPDYLKAKFEMLQPHLMPTDINRRSNLHVIEAPDALCPDVPRSFSSALSGATQGQSGLSNGGTPVNLNGSPTIGENLRYHHFQQSFGQMGSLKVQKPASAKKLTSSSLEQDTSNISHISKASELEELFNYYGKKPIPVLTKNSKEFSAGDKELFSATKALGSTPPLGTRNSQLAAELSIASGIMGDQGNANQGQAGKESSVGGSSAVSAKAPRVKCQKILFPSTAEESTGSTKQNNQLSVQQSPISPFEDGGQPKTNSLHDQAQPEVEQTGSKYNPHLADDDDSEDPNFDENLLAGEEFETDSPRK